MFAVSADYKQAINGIERSIEAVLEVIIDEHTVSSATTSTGVNANEVCNGIFRPTPFRGVGSVDIQESQGWRGQSVADTGGTLQPEPLTVNYTPAVNAKHLWVIARQGNYPTDFTVEIKVNNVWTTVATVTNHNRWYWFMQLANVTAIESVRLIVTRISTSNEPLLIMECGVITKVVFTKEDISDVDLLAEISTEAHNPVGRITANDLDAVVSNENGWFSTTNEGPLQGLIKPNLKMKMHTGVRLPNGQYEFVCWGTYYIQDWVAPSSELTANLVGKDRLHSILSKPTPDLLPAKGLTLKQMFERLFYALGLTSSDFYVDASLNRIVPVSWITPGKVEDCLTNYCTAGLCTVYVNNYDKIIVSNLYRSNIVPVDTWTEDNQMMSFSNPQSFLSTYASVEVPANNPYLSDVTSVAKIEDIEIGTGTTALQDIKFNKVIGNISYVWLQNAVNCKVQDTAYGAKTGTITIANSGAPETISVWVFAQTIEASGPMARAVDNDLYEVWPDRVLKIDNPFIQKPVDATNYATAMLKVASDPKAFFRVSTRGNPAIELLDVVTIAKAQTLKIATDILAVVVRQKITYNGGLNAELVLRKPLT